MITASTRTALLGGASLLAASSVSGLTAAAAQDTDEDFAQECVDLFVYVEDQPGIVLDDEPVLVQLIERNDGDACAQQLVLLERQAGIEAGGTAAAAAPALQEREPIPTPTTQIERREVEREARPVLRQEREVERETTTASRAVQEQVEIEQTVTVVGEVDVATAVPTVRVRQAAPTVAIQRQAPEVTVDQAAPTIVVREAPARIRMEMPTITIEQDAPEIVVTMPDPAVRVANAQPRVEVRQAQPRISVQMADPVVDLDLRAVAGETTDQVRTNIRRDAGTLPRPAAGERALAAGDLDGDANVLVADAGEPQVQLEGLDQEASVTFNGAEPEVRFEGAEAQVEVVGEPTVEYRRVGEPRVTFNRASAQGVAGEPREERRGFLGRLTDDDDDAEVATATAPVVSAGDGMLVSDLVGRSVIGQNGEELGDIARFVRSGGGVYAVIERGGFLGLGEKEIAMPAENILMQGDQLQAANLTEERVEQLRDQDISERLNLADEDRVTIGG